MRLLTVCISICLGSILAITAGGFPARADVLIIDTNSGKLKVGTVLKDDEFLQVPAGKFVIVMMPSGVTRDIVGPYRIKAGDISKGQTASEAFKRAIQKFNVTRDGGARDGDDDDAIRGVGTAKCSMADRVAGKCPGALKPGGVEAGHR